MQIVDEGLPERQEITRAAAGIGVYAGAFGTTFGAISVASGLTLAQTMVLSVVMFSGASQFAFVGVIAGGGSPLAALPSTLLLATRNAFYGVPITEIIRPRGIARLWTAHFVIDETTAMAVSQRTPEAGRYAFWVTGLILFGLWTLGSLAGGLIGSAINPSAFGLDAAAPAIFLALLYPQLGRPQGRLVATLGAVVAFALIPIAPSGVPVIAAALVAVVVGLVTPSPEPTGEPDRADA